MVTGGGMSFVEQPTAVTPRTTAAIKRTRAIRVLDGVILSAVGLHMIADVYALTIAISAGLVGEYFCVRALSWPIVLLVTAFYVRLYRKRRR